jgi:hypothetical protein
MGSLESGYSKIMVSRARQLGAAGLLSQLRGLLNVGVSSDRREAKRLLHEAEAAVETAKEAPWADPDHDVIGDIREARGPGPEQYRLEAPSDS